MCATSALVTLAEMIIALGIVGARTITGRRS
jgi:hypothetical protein